MNILTFNSGSSSLSVKIFSVESDSIDCIYSGKGYHVATQTDEPSYVTHRLNNQESRETLHLQSHGQASRVFLHYFSDHNLSVDAIGHRFVHGGTRFRESVFITPEVHEGLVDCIFLAPIHNPNSLQVINACCEALPLIPQYAVFDTAFHANLPEPAWRYALPFEMADQFGYRKYGFHGISYQYVCEETARFLNKPVSQVQIIACHLGTGGSSVAAIKNGRSVDTSMGYSPLAGLIMSTRCGDIDPAILLDLIQKRGFSAESVSQILNQNSGFLGISGSTSDLLELVAKTHLDPRARLAVEMAAHRLKSHIGASLTHLDRLDALVFTDDIGVKAWQFREEVCSGLDWLGIHLNADLNRNAQTDQIAALQSAESETVILSIPTDEEIMIARQGINLLTH